MLTILTFSLIFIPLNTAMAAYGANVNDYFASYKQEVNNPEPYISSLNPSYANRGANARTVTITGDGFVPSSIARVNGSNRNTTFIDASHLLIQLNGNDMYRDDEFFITVFNGEPGGGYSNANSFTLKNVVGIGSNTNEVNSNSTNSNYNSNSYTTSSTNSTSSNSDTNTTNSNENSPYSNLASSVILGSNTFLPSGLVQWILLAIIILIIIILTRKVFGAREEYETTPLKHA